MAASRYLLELDDQRERLVSDMVCRIVGVAKGSAEHEAAVDFTMRSLTYHSYLDSQAHEVGSVL